MLNIEKYHDLIIKIVRARFDRSGLEFDDVIQEVCLKIHRLNHGSSPYDKHKCAPSSYIYLVAQSITRDMWNKKQKPPQVTAPGSYYEDVFLWSDWVTDMKKEDIQIQKIFLMSHAGYSRRDIAKTLSCTEHFVRASKKRIQQKISS